MSQRVETYQLPFEQGGFNANPNVDLITPISFVGESRNINLHNGGREKRGGTSKVYTVPSNGKVLGIHDFTLESLTQFIVVATDDGSIYKNATTTIYTGWSATRKSWFLTLRDKLYILDGIHTPLSWNGVTASAAPLASIPSDWTGTNNPKVMFTHSNGAAFRNIALGVPGFLDYAYCSAVNDGSDFSDTNVVKVLIPTNNAFGLVTGAEFGSRAICFGKKKAYIINDADPVVANWGYQAAQWEGGVANPWLLIKTPNDLIAMMEDGEIYSVLAVQQFGDYQAASIARPSFMHKWIKDNVDLSRIDEAHASYDPNLRAIKFFLPLFGKVYVDTCAVYFIDRPPAQAWSIHDNPNSNSGYRSAASTSVRLSPGNEKVYTGGYDGEVWTLEEVLTFDDVNGFPFSVRSPHLSFDQPRLMKLYTGGRITLIPKGDVQIVLKWWVDGVPQEDVVIAPILGSVYGFAVYDSAVYGGDEIADAIFELGQIGKRIQMDFQVNNPGDSIFMSAAYIDFKWIGKMPDKVLS